MLTVREIQESDIELIAAYWLEARPEFLTGMGVDLKKMPSHEQWISMLSTQLNQAYTEKQSYCTIWELDKKPVGHSNINKIVFGKEAYMHLHLWDNQNRQKGLGVSFVSQSIPFFFNNMKLETLFCEPYALNPAPNHTLKKLGFNFEKTYSTVPGWINFEQEVNLWSLSRGQFLNNFQK
jgi:RimJ/RimL family protein N-acetyltransferase